MEILPGPAEIVLYPACKCGFFCIYCIRIVYYTTHHLNIRHMKTHTHPTHNHSSHVGSTAGTILLAIGFLALVMMLTYLFTNGVK